MLYTYGWITAYIFALSAVLGAVFGSFFNCMACRIAHGESVWKGRSHCAVCGHTLRGADLIPVFSYLFLKGKCRYCGEKISPRYMGVELLTAAVFVSLVFRYDVSWQFLRCVVLACILLTLALVDLEIYEIPDRFLLAGILWWAVTLPCFGKENIMGRIGKGILGGFVIAGALLLLTLVFDKVTGKEGLGGGDIKLFFVTGLYLGLAGNLLNLLVSCVTGLLFVVVWKRDKIPFGPAIALSTWFCLLFGDMIVQWYFGLFL